MFAVRHLSFLVSEQAFNFQIVFSTSCPHKSSWVWYQRAGTEAWGKTQKILGSIVEGEGNSYVKPSELAAEQEAGAGKPLPIPASCLLLLLLRFRATIF